MDNWERERDLREWENGHFERVEATECCSAKVTENNTGDFVRCPLCQEMAAVILIKDDE